MYSARCRRLVEPTPWNALVRNGCTDFRTNTCCHAPDPAANAITEGRALADECRLDIARQGARHFRLRTYWQSCRGIWACFWHERADLGERCFASKGPNRRLGGVREQTSILRDMRRRFVAYAARRSHATHR